MATYEPNPDKYLSKSQNVVIESYEVTDNVTLYHICVTVGEYQWTVKHRYSEFYDLNEKLVTENGLERSLLPPKKLFGNQSENFLQKRKNELENYLKTLLRSGILSPHFWKFLDFHKYEIHSITHSLAEELFYQGDHVLHSKELYSMTPIQLYALTERLKLPIPTCDSGDKCKDIGHILDFLSRIQFLLICGSNKPIGTSNIVPNKLPFDLSSLKSLQLLKLDGCDPRMVRGLVNVRKTVTKLQVQDSMRSIKDLLLCDVLHWDPFSPPTSAWTSTTFVDFSYNQLNAIDNSIWLLPHVEMLDLSHNQISEVKHLDHLTRLTSVNFSFNRFHFIPPLHTRLGNIVTLNFGGNAIESLHGFSKLYSLIHLDLQSNKINNISEILYLASLPCLENLNLTGNSLTTIIDYRTRILELFNSRASEICLDNEQTTQKELDTVAILQALRRGKEMCRSTSENSLVLGENGEQSRCSKSSTTNYSDRRVKSSNNNIPSSSSDNITDFRQYIESIREEGGVGWLRLWNQCLKESKHKALNANCSAKKSKKQSLNHECAASDALGQTRSVMSTSQNEVLNADQAVDDKVESLTVSDEIRQQNIESKMICVSHRDFILPEWLPNILNKDFISYLGALIKENVSAEASDLKPPPLQTSQCEASTSLLLPFWTIGIVHGDSSEHVFPACLINVSNSILVFSLVGIQQDYSPVLSFFKSISLNSSAKISVGRYHHYLRVETKNKKHTSTCFVFKFPSRNFCANFLNEVQIRFQEQEGKPLKIIYKELQMESVNLNDEMSIFQETVCYNWIAVDTPLDVRKDSIVCIAIAKSCVCIIQEEIGGSTTANAETSVIKVLHKWDVGKHVIDLSLLNPTTNGANSLLYQSSGQNALFNNKNNSESDSDKTSKNLKTLLQASGFGVVLHLHNSQVIVIRFPSSAGRDEFLDAFTKERFASLSRLKGTTTENN